MENRGSIDWTIGKILTMILLVIVLILVAYGISTKGLNPLIDKIGARMDDILILLNIQEDEGGEEGCYSFNVTDFEFIGLEFLDNLEIEENERDKIKIKLCNNRICTITFSEEIGNYRVNNDVFEKEIGGNWKEFKGGRFIPRLVEGGFNIGYNVVISEEQLKTVSWKTNNIVEIEGVEYLARLDSDDNLEIDVSTLKDSNFQNLNLEGLFIKPYINVKKENKNWRHSYVESLDISEKEKYELKVIERGEFYKLLEEEDRKNLIQWTLIKEFIGKRCI